MVPGDAVTGRRLGVTMRRMRVDYPGGAHEMRDALAEDWGRFLAEALPGAVWLPLPNLGEQTVAMARALGLTGLICSGGEDWGVSSRRDATERALLDWARSERLPVLGVCRGAQVICRLEGGVELAPVSGHAGTRHTVRLADGSRREVNSFHAKGIPAAGFPSQFRVEATTEDGLWVEAFRHVALPWAGLVWHPEREKDIAVDDYIFMRNLLGNRV